MTKFEVLSLLMSIVAVLLIPMLVVAYRGIVKWTRTEERLEQIARDIAKLVVDKDKTHLDMLGQMKDDRNATNRRLEWLERNLWEKHGN